MLRACRKCGLLYRDGAEYCGVDGSPIADSKEDLLVGRSLGQYEVLERLAIGGSAVIYRARHRVVEHEVALKVLLGEKASRPGVVERFRREAYAAGRILHRNVVRTFDFGTSEDGAAFVTMELLDGLTLSQYMAGGKRLPEASLKHLIRQITEGLAAIHARGYVHRDVKPGNIVLVSGADGDLVAKIIDFGLVRAAGTWDRNQDFDDQLTRQGVVLGTPHYMSPEVIAGEPPSFAADLYGLGATLYEMLAGRPPFKGGLSDILTAHLEKLPPPLPSAGALETLAVRLLEKNASDRPASALDVLAQLDAPAPSRDAVRVAALVTALSMLMIVATAVIAYQMRPNERAQKPPANHHLPAVIEVRIDSDPTGAQVSTRHGVLGKTPLSAPLPTAGPLELTIQKPGYRPASVRWRPAANSVVKVNLQAYR